MPPPGRDAWRYPQRVEPVPGTPFGLAVFPEPVAVSGPAVGALVTGVASILVSFVVAAAGMVDVALAGEGEAAGGGLLAGGAFAVLALFLGGAGLVLGLIGIRRTRGGLAGPAARGRGMAVAGLVCGSVGLATTLCGLGLAVTAVVGS